MTQDFRLLYNEMSQKIQKTFELELKENQKAELGYIAAIDCWDKVKETLKHRGFKDDSDEINYFRNIKPRFFSWIEYMILLKEALLYAPSEASGAIIFWKWELNRFKSFYNNNIDFIVYYERKDWHLNSTYFLRRNNKTTDINPRVYDTDPAYYTSHDPRISSYLAHKMYSKYARRRLWELTGRIKANNGTKDSVIQMTDEKLEVSRRRKVI